jgi:uncharacterized protein
MNRIYASQKVYVATSRLSGAGRGVFAKSDLKKDETIELCPVIEVPLTDSANDDEKGLLTNYFFYFGEGLAMVLGFGSLYNHSYNANATYIKRIKDKVVEFKAIEDISAGQEITVNYNNGEATNQTPIGRGVPGPTN